jgi:hypothetical protein
VTIEGGDHWNGANVCVPTLDASPPPLPADVAAPDPETPPEVSIARGSTTRIAALFGLVERTNRWLNKPGAAHARRYPRPA